ncbi:hypothetical protein BDW59DRAFT_143839 [Aspergillus cavernicola]|uniref:Uncharacterized protein n=1 Tax=Aspergillus cavernicola TaxID=176166 RepID=A0ABR4IJ46_9EURO
MYGDATGFPPHDPEGKSELDSAPVYQLVAPGYADEVVKQPYSPLGSSGTQAHQPPARMMAELPGDEVMMVEMSDSHRLNELEGNETPKR